MREICMKIRETKIKKLAKVVLTYGCEFLQWLIPCADGDAKFCKFHIILHETAIP